MMKKGYEQWKDDYYSKNTPKLTKQDISALKEYSDGSYTAINGAERFEKDSEAYKKVCRQYGVENLDRYKKISDNISTAISKFDLDEDIITHRYVTNVDYITGSTSNLEALSKSIGGQYTEKGFFSTCIFENQTKGFGGKTPIHIEVRVPKGSKGAYINEFSEKKNMEFEFLLDMVQPKNYMLMGDHRQSIYRWRGADPDYLIELMKQKDVVTYPLAENYRNGSDILTYAQSIIMQAGYEYRDYSVPMRNTRGKVINVEYSPIALVRTIKKYGHYHDWFILCRTNDQVDQMMFYLEKEKIPSDSFKRSQLTNKELYEKMKEDSVKVLTIHTSKGLEAPNVIVVGAKFYDTEEKCISYVAATRARDLLVWTSMPTRQRRAQQISAWET